MILAISAIVIGFCLYRAFIGVTYTKGTSISADKFECSKAMTSISMDNPIERLRLTRFHIEERNPAVIVSTAYFFVVPYLSFEITNGCSLTRRM